MAEPTASGSQKFYGWINVVFLFLLYSIMMGFVFYGFTVIFPAMVESLGWGRGEASLAHTIRGLLAGFLTPVAAFSIGKIGAKKTLGIGLLVGTVALILLGTVTTQLWQWIVLWGVVMPTAFALGGLLPIQTTVTFWFNLRRATAMGIVMTGAAVAGFIAAPMYTYIIKQSGTWETGWLVAAGFCVAGLILTFFIKDTPQSIGQFPDGIDPHAPVSEEISGKPKPRAVYQTKEPWVLKEVLRTRVVWLQLVCMLSQAWALYLVTVHGVLHLTDQNFTPMQAASAISTLIIFSGIARFPTGVVADRIEPRILAAIALLGMAVALVGIWQAPQSLSLLLIIAAVYGFFFGATVIIFPMLTANYFGPQAYAPIMGFMAPILIGFAAPMPFLAGLLYDYLGSYDWAFIPVTTLLLIAAVCGWFLYPPEKKEVLAE